MFRALTHYPSHPFGAWLVRQLYRLLDGLMIGVVLFHYRVDILQGLGNYLMAEDAPQPSEAVFIFSGEAVARGNRGAELLLADFAPQAICTGELIHDALAAAHLHLAECDLTAQVMLEAGVPPESVRVVHHGTSTFEEVEWIAQYCQQQGLRRIILVSSRFHCRRIQWLADQLLRPQGIEVLVCGAPTALFDEERWWQSEYGLIGLNNEYVKLLYYRLRY